MSTPSHSPRSGPVRWTTQPTAPKPTYIPIVRPAIDRPVAAAILSHVCQGCDLHHDGQNTIPCVGELNGCTQCVQGRAWRRYWFLAVQLPGLGKRAVLSITDGAWRGCPRLQDTEASLRGLTLKAYRLGRSVNGPMKVEIGRPVDPATLAPEFDLKEHLLHVWGWKYTDGQV